MARAIGVAGPGLSPNEIETILQCHYYFNEMQTKWINDNPTQAQGKLLENLRSNSERGQQLLIFSLIHDIRNNTSMDQKVKQLILHNILPERLAKDPSNRKEIQDFAVTKVLKGVAQRGWKIDKLFNMLDKDKTGSITTQEILEGCKTYLNVWLN